MEPKKKVGVIVVGDIGRSPRMQYHALSLAREGFSVEMIGYAGSEPISQLQENENVSFHFIQTCPEPKRGLLSKIALPLKVVWQFVTLLWALTFGQHYDFLLLQNPPAVPAMVVCWLYCLFTSTCLVIDWHNYGYSILALSLGRQHWFVSVYHFIERHFCKSAYAHLCVTKAMKDDLKSNWNVNATVLYDRPPEMFRPISIEEKHNLFEKLSTSYPELTASRFMCAEGEGVKLKDNRPGLVVSSTSWTEDEDFSILLSALEDYEEKCESVEVALPKLVCVITGKGPLKQLYSELISHKEWRNIECVMPWLEPEDYPKLLASADLGICLHTSSSGLDLPMKVVDMFGCGLPVAAFFYPCLTELVNDGENSMVFEDASTLSTKLCQWFDGFPKQNDQSEKFRANLQDFRKQHWHHNWTANAKPIFSS